MSDDIREQAAPKRASTTRRGGAIRLIVLHEDPRPAAETLAASAAGTALATPHYYVALDGSVTRLVPEARAAHHSGLARLDSRRVNIDRISIGVMIEGHLRADMPRDQILALRGLCSDLQARHGLLADAVIMQWVAASSGENLGSLLPVDLPAPPRPRAAAVLSAQAPRLATLGVESDPAQARQLWIFLANEGSRQRSKGFNIGTAFDLHAAKNTMGPALAASSARPQWIALNGRTYNYQHFARDTAFNEGENWGAVQSLSALLGDGIAAPGTIEFELIKSAYAASIAASKTPVAGVTDLKPNWLFHQMAAQQRLGPAFSGNYRITVAGAIYSLQVFGADTLYTPIANPEANTNWRDVRKLSETPDGALREALWAETYKPCGAAYDAASPLQKEAAVQKLGTPLTGKYRATFQNAAIDVQVFALDTLYQEPNGPVKRMSALPIPTEVQNWTPKAATPPPPPPVPAAVKSAPAPVAQPGGDRNSAGWPPVPSFKLFTSTAERQKAFGAFQFVHEPVASNAENIRILGTWEQENIVPVVVPQMIGRGIRGAPKNGTIRWHRAAVNQLLRMWAAWEQAGLLDRIKSWDGSYVPRFIRGGPTRSDFAQNQAKYLSNHAFGTAFDINASTNDLGVTPPMVGQPGCVRELVAIANQFGFYWGGHFATRLDGMHFEVAVVQP